MMMEWGVSGLMKDKTRYDQPPEDREKEEGSRKEKVWPVVVTITLPSYLWSVRMPVNRG